jgi:hypothetical protein
MLFGVKNPNMPFDLKKIARENPLRDEDKYEINIPKEYGQERQSAWDNAIGGRLADALSTYHFLKNSRSTESNPTLAWAKNDPIKTVAGLVGTDLAMIPVIKKIEKKHPKLAKGLLMGLGGIGAGLAVNNFRNSQKYRNYDLDGKFVRSNK